MPKIEKIYAYIVDEGEGDEGIPAVQLGDSFFPLIGADMERIKSLEPYVEMVGDLKGKKMVFKEFVLVDE